MSGTGIPDPGIFFYYRVTALVYSSLRAYNGFRE